MDRSPSPLSGNMAHHCRHRLITADTAQASTPSLPAYAQLTRPVLAFLYPEMCDTLAQHNYTHQIMHPPSTGEHCNCLDISPGLEPRTTTQLHGNGMLPRLCWWYCLVISCYFPNCPSCSACSSTTHSLTMYMCTCSWVWTLKQKWHGKTRRQRKTNLPNEQSERPIKHPNFGHPQTPVTCKGPDHKQQ